MGDRDLIAEARSPVCRDHYTAKEAKSLALQLADALEARQVDEAEAWDEGWAARASRGYAHLKAGESVPAPSHINPYRLGERHEPEYGDPYSCADLGHEDCGKERHEPEPGKHEDTCFADKCIQCAPQPSERDRSAVPDAATAERVICEVLRQAVVASGETLEQWTGAVASELRAHGLLSEGEPTEVARNLANATALTGQDARVIAEAAVKVAAAGEIAIIEEHREKWMARAFRAEDERDAALAAVERVRALLARKSTAGSGFYLNPDRTELDMLSDLYSDRFADELVAALDGAPEPEVKP